MIVRCLAALFLTLAPAIAEEVKPGVEKTSETGYRIGSITFDSKSREIRIPAEVNLTEGLLEFIVVHRKGKVHEALLRTDASALHLQLALTLLRYRPSQQLRLLPDGKTPPPVTAEERKAASLALFIEWDDAGKTRRVPANEWIQHATEGSAMPVGTWIFSEADVNEGKFSPETTGDIVAIYTTNTALINYPGSDHLNDDVWLPYPKRVPPVGTSVTLILSPDPS